jgi:hypothetical protein
VAFVHRQQKAGSPGARKKAGAFLKKWEKAAWRRAAPAHQPSEHWRSARARP